MPKAHLFTEAFLAAPWLGGRPQWGQLDIIKWQKALADWVLTAERDAESETTVTGTRKSQYHWVSRYHLLYLSHC